MTIGRTFAPGFVVLCTVGHAFAADAARVDHVGLPLPDYTTGEECLFCHRDDIGPDWLKTSHAWTTRAANDAPKVAALPADANPQTLSFSSSGLDCVSCHGLVPPEHTTNGALAWFGKSHAGDAKLKEAICAQCHLRGGASQSTERPYPNNFFAGDDLFADFKVDLKNMGGLDRNDQHVFVKTRSVLEGESTRTCDDCHKIHVPPGARQRDPNLHSAICGY